jgi:hypothetical protein
MLDKLVSNLSLRESSIDLALKEVSAKYSVPIGLEMALSANENLEVKIDIKKGTLRDVLDAVVRVDAKYEWQLVDGVVNVCPRIQRDDLLRTRVESFRVQQRTGLLDLRADITKLPELRAKLDSAHVRPIIVAWATPDFAEASPGFRINVKDVTLRELLNQIVSTSDIKYWVVRRYGDRFQFLALRF